MSELDPIDLAVHTAKVQAHRALRWARDRRAPLSPGRRGRLLIDLPILAEAREQLWNRDLDARELPLEWGKVENLRVAARALNGLEFESQQPFSFWTQVGAPLRVRGFVPGRELREGCVVPGIGGGLCLLSNGLYRAAQAADFEVLERHPHSRRPPGSRAALGEDATVAWNYVDLRFASGRSWRLEVSLDAETLSVVIRGERRGAFFPVIHERRGPPRTEARGPAAAAVDAGPSCLSCEQPCHYSKTPAASPAGPASPTGRSSWLVDAAWPEYVELARTELGPGHRLLQPIDGERLRRPRYAWPRISGVETRQFPALTLARSLRARGLAAQGPARQRAMLADDRRLAQAMAAALEPKDTTVVVSQSLLPHLQLLGALGGRRVRVLMQRLPLLELEARLDEAQKRHPESPTLGDFRCDRALAEAELTALDHAEEILTPHASIAALFPAKARLLPWHLPVCPPARAPRRGPGSSGPLRLCLPSSCVGRKGARELRAALARMPHAGGFARPGQPSVVLHVAGRELEGPRFWADLPHVQVLHASDPGLHAQTAEFDAVVLPAWTAHEPRALLRALALDVPVIASHACGLGARPGLSSVAAGDVDGLLAALLALEAPRGAHERAV